MYSSAVWEPFCCRRSSAQSGGLHRRAQSDAIERDKQNNEHARGMTLAQVDNVNRQEIAIFKVQTFTTARTQDKRAHGDLRRWSANQHHSFVFVSLASPLAPIRSPHFRFRLIARNLWIWNSLTDH